jgi:hypothetical protein
MGLMSSRKAVWRGNLARSIPAIDARGCRSTDACTFRNVQTGQEPLAASVPHTPAAQIRKLDECGYLGLSEPVTSLVDRNRAGANPRGIYSS